MPEAPLDLSHDGMGAPPTAAELQMAKELERGARVMQLVPPPQLDVILRASVQYFALTVREIGHVEGAPEHGEGAASAPSAAQPQYPELATGSSARDLGAGASEQTAATKKARKDAERVAAQAARAAKRQSAQREAKKRAREDEKMLEAERSKKAKHQGQRLRQEAAGQREARRIEREEKVQKRFLTGTPVTMPRGAPSARRPSSPAKFVLADGKGKEAADDYYSTDKSKNDTKGDHSMVDAKGVPKTASEESDSSLVILCTTPTRRKDGSKEAADAPGASPTPAPHPASCPKP